MYFCSQVVTLPVDAVYTNKVGECLHSVSLSGTMCQSSSCANIYCMVGAFWESLDSCPLVSQQEVRMSKVAKNVTVTLRRDSFHETHLLKQNKKSQWLCLYSMLARASTSLPLRFLMRSMPTSAKLQHQVIIH